MSRKRPHVVASDSLSPSDWPVKLAKAFAALEWPDCRCKQSLISCCLIGAEQGCWHRRKKGACDCKVRWLPSCLLTNPHGCPKRRLGAHSKKLIRSCLLEQPNGCFARQEIGICECDLVPKPSCQCPLAQMPCCMAAGCPERQLGHICDCPRGPSQRCPHMGVEQQKVMQMAFDMLARWYPQWNPYDFWAFLQRETDERRRWDDRYDDPEMPGIPEDMTDREQAIKVMEFRAANHVGLRHPEDRRAPVGEEEQARLVAQWQNFAVLDRMVKGGGNVQAA